MGTVESGTGDGNLSIDYAEEAKNI